MVDNLLDILTHGEHRRTKRHLDDRRKMREEEERMRVILDSAKSQETSSSHPQPAQNPQAQPPAMCQVVIPVQAMNLDKLKSLSDLGIDTSFLEGVGM